MDWNAVDVNRTSPVPLYYQVVGLIRESIQARQLKPEEKLPSERELADLLGISRMTARQAIRVLVRDGTLAVRHGVGTFVADPKLTYRALHLLGFTEEAMLRGSKVSSQVLEQLIARPSLSVSKALKLRASDRIVKIVRLRSSEDVPLVLETSHVPLQCCPGLIEEDLATQSLYALLENRYHLPLLWAAQSVEAAIATEFESHLLDVNIGAPVLLVEGVTYSANDQPIERFKAVYRADRVTLTLESGRSGSVGSDSPLPNIRVIVGLE
jgi:GntR family transcriptional regulator